MTVILSNYRLEEHYENFIIRQNTEWIENAKIENLLIDYKRKVVKSTNKLLMTNALYK